MRNQDANSIGQLATRDGLESSWLMVRLGDYVTKIGSGSTPRGGEAVYVKKGVPLIRSMNVHFDGLRPEGLAFITMAEADKLKNVAVQEGDVLLNITGASIGRVTTVPGELAGARVNQHVCIIRPTSAFLPKFLTYFFATPVEQMRINECQIGATRQALTKQMIEDWQVPMPSLEEQKRIVAEIEKQFTRLEVGLAALRRMQVNLKRYRSAVLKAASEGRLVPTEAELARTEGRSFESGQQLLVSILTERRQNWQGRGKYKEPDAAGAEGLPNLPEGWTWTIMPQLGELGRGKSKHRPRDDSRLYGGSYPFIQTGDVRKSGGTVRQHSQTYSEFGLKQSKLWPVGTLCITIAANIAETGILTFDACFPDSVVGFVHHNMVTTRFVEFFIRTAKEKLEQFAPATAQKNINLDVLQNVAIPLPPLAEQTRIVAEVERLLSVVEELEAVITTNLQRAKRLRGSILAGGFRSERSPAQPAPKAKGTPDASHQIVKSIRPIITPMKMQPKLTPESLVETVSRNKGRMTPSDLCMASNVEEEVEGFFELLRECRDRGLLVVPSGIGGIIKLAKS